MSIGPDPNQAAKRNFKRIGGFFLAGLIILGSLFGYWKYRETKKETAAVAARAAAETLRLAETHKKQQKDAAAEASRVAEAKKKAQEEAEALQAEAVRRTEAEKQQLIRDFVFPAYITKVPGTVALIVLDGEQNYDAALSERFSELLRRADVATDWSVFRPAFIGSEIFKLLLSGNYSRMDSFHPDDYCERLVCIRTRSSAVRITAPADLISTEFVLTLLVVSPDTGQLLSTTEVKAKAVGFSEKASLKNAVDLAWIPTRREQVNRRRIFAC